MQEWIVQLVVALIGIAIIIVIAYFWKKNAKKVDKSSSKSKDLGSILKPSDVLWGDTTDLTYQGEYLSSPDKNFRFANIGGRGIVYNVETLEHKYMTGALQGYSGKTFITLLENGNLVLSNPDHSKTWSTHTGDKGITLIALTNEGNLVGMTTTNGEQVWMDGSFID